MTRPLLTAHSGRLGTLPNSFAHVDAALASGLDFIEVDVRLGAGRLHHRPARRRSSSSHGVLTIP